MKIFADPISTTCRSVLLFIADNDIPVEVQSIDLLKGEHQSATFASINPNRLVPTLKDDGLLLTESSAILKYLADKTHSPAYPRDLKQRAKVNEMMDWLNTNFYRDWGYGLIYPQAFPHMRCRSDEAQSATVELGEIRAKRWLQLLNDHWIGPSNAYLCGDRITIADYFGAGLVTIGELIRFDFTPYPNVHRWLAIMAKQPSWQRVNEPFHRLRDAIAGPGSRAA
jgi:glutathione S-transferase